MMNFCNSYECIVRSKSLQTEHAELMLKYGVSVTASHILESIYFDNEKWVELLLQYAEDDLKQNSFLLEYAINRNKPNSRKILEILLKHEFSVNGDSKYYSPLIDAIQNRNLDSIELLLYYGADPCKKYTYEFGDKDKDGCIPLQYAFCLPASNIESIVRYAALYVDYENKIAFLNFFRTFRLDNTASLHLNYAHTCVAEAKYLKTLYLSSNNWSLFDFLISQGNQLNIFLDNPVIINDIFKLLTKATLPIYKCLALKKIKRINILNSFHENLKCSITFEERVTLNSDCVEKICSFLSKKDLISFWMACVER